MQRDGIRVLLVTQVRLYADGLAKALGCADAIGRVATEPSCHAALHRLSHEAADVALLDLAGIDRPDDARAFARAARPANVIAFAVRPTEDEVLSWAEHGVSGILTLEASLDELLEAVVAAAGGESLCSAGAVTALMRQIAVAAESRNHVTHHVELTRRERQVAALLVRGCSNKEIAAELTLGLSTVKNHVHQILSKSDARTRAEAAARLTGGGIQIMESAGTGSQADRGGWGPGS